LENWKNKNIIFTTTFFSGACGNVVSHYDTKLGVKWCEEEGEVFISISFIRHGNIRFSRTLASDITVNNSLQQNGIQILYFSLRRIDDLILF
jgi:hypothetical protein